MTRAEQKEQKLQKELALIESLKGREISAEERNLFRTTSIWKEFRHAFYVIGEKILKNGKKKEIIGTDYLTGSKLNKNFNLHHLRSDKKVYCDLDKDFYLPLNNQSHDVVHNVYTQMCKDRNYLKRLEEVVNRMGELNNWEDF